MEDNPRLHPDAGISPDVMRLIIRCNGFTPGPVPPSVLIEKTMPPSRAILLNPTRRSRLGMLLGMSSLALGVCAVAWLHRPASTAQAQDSAPAASFGLAPSLQGTVPDGVLADSGPMDAVPAGGPEAPGLPLQGGADLRLSPELIRRFDYWLTTHGERDLPAIRADIQADLTDELNPRRLLRAMRLLDAYVAYKTELSRLQPLPTGTYDAAALGQQLQAIRGVRGRHFTPDETLALFGPDDTTDDHALARLRIAQDPTLTPPERSRQLARLSQRLPPEQRAAETEPVLHLSVADAVAEARARGADATEVRSIRTRLVGPEAAERLARVDAEQADWQARVQGYLALKRERPDDAASHKAARFSPSEQLRLAAYE